MNKKLIMLYSSFEVQNFKVVKLTKKLFIFFDNERSNTECLSRQNFETKVLKEIPKDFNISQYTLITMMNFRDGFKKQKIV